MTRAQTIEIEQTVRRVLSGILGEAPDELTARGAGEQPPTPTPPGGGPDEPAAIPPAVLTAVEELCRDLSPEQASTLASMFEAMGEEDEEAPEEDQEAGVESYAGIELSSEAEAKAEGKRIARARGGAVSAIIRLLRKAGARLFRAAVRAAKGGRAAFNKWVNSLSNFNPVKWAIKALPDVLLYELINWLASQRASQRGEVMTGGRTNEIEQAVRRVLSEALTEPR